MGVGLVTILAHPPKALAQVPGACESDSRPVRYTVLAELSVLLVHTYKGGMLGLFGHEHDIRAHDVAGSIVYDERNPSCSRVSVTLRTDSLLVVAAGDSSDIPAITAAMREDVLQVDRFPHISFASTGITVHDSTVHLLGDLTMVGTTRSVEMDVTGRVMPETLHVAGSFTVKQTDFGIRPYSAVLGTIKVKDEVRFFLDIVAGASR